MVASTTMVFVGFEVRALITTLVGVCTCNTLPCIARFARCTGFVARTAMGGAGLEIDASFTAQGKVRGTLALSFVALSSTLAFVVAASTMFDTCVCVHARSTAQYVAFCSIAGNAVSAVASFSCCAGSAAATAVIGVCEKVRTDNRGLAFVAKRLIAGARTSVVLTGRTSQTIPVGFTLHVAVEITRHRPEQPKHTQSRQQSLHQEPHFLNPLVLCT